MYRRRSRTASLRSKRRGLVGFRTMMTGWRSTARCCAMAATAIPTQSIGDQGWRPALFFDRLRSRAHDSSPLSSTRRPARPSARPRRPSVRIRCLAIARRLAHHFSVTGLGRSAGQFARSFFQAFASSDLFVASANAMSRLRASRTRTRSRRKIFSDRCVIPS